MIIFVAASLAWRGDLLRALVRKDDRNDLPLGHVSRAESK
jgi:hypothetical protein